MPLLATFQYTFLLALGFFTLNFLLGLSLQLRWVRWHYRPLHHALYFLACACTLVTGWFAFVAALPWWPYLVLLGGMLLVPRTRPGQRDHLTLACLLAAAYALAAWKTLSLLS